MTRGLVALGAALLVVLCFTVAAWLAFDAGTNAALGEWVSLKDRGVWEPRAYERSVPAVQESTVQRVPRGAASWRWASSAVFYDYSVSSATVFPVETLRR